MELADNFLKYQVFLHSSVESTYTAKKLVSLVTAALMFSLLPVYANMWVILMIHESVFHNVC